MRHPISRRSLAAAALGAAMPNPASASTETTHPRGSITDVPGIEAGHWTSGERPTGCTAILARGGAVAGVDARGGAPGTSLTDVLRPEMINKKVNGVLLTGGSAFGLEAAFGVMQFLEENGVGEPFGNFRLPDVPGAVLFDLGIGGMKPRPNARSGYAAAKAASSGPLQQGNVGAGAGATVGKILGRERAMKSGLGSASLRWENGLTIGAAVAVNAIGDVVDPLNGKVLAGVRTEDGEALVNAMELIRTGAVMEESRAGENTTIGVVAANVNWTRPQATKVAQMAHDGLAWAVRPAHMPHDGDTLFALGTGGMTVDDALLGRIGALAAEVTAQAIVSAILEAEGIPGFPAHRDLRA